MLGFIQTDHVETVVLVINISGYVRDKPCVSCRMFLEKKTEEQKKQN